MENLKHVSYQSVLGLFSLMNLVLAWRVLLNHVYAVHVSPWRFLRCYNIIVEMAYITRL